MENKFHRFHASMTSALSEAARVCVMWRRPNEDKKINGFQLEKLAREYDAENPCPEGACYEVSVEGAIGYCPGAQYLTRWLFYPCMDDETITEFVNDICSILKEPQTGVCPKCGTPYEEDAKFCMNCGAPRQ